MAYGGSIFVGGLSYAMQDMGRLLMSSFNKKPVSGKSKNNSNNLSTSGGSGGSPVMIPEAQELAELANKSGKIDGLPGTSVPPSVVLESLTDFLGSGYQTRLDGKKMEFISKDGLKGVRLMTKKVSGIFQANYETFDSIGNTLTNYHVNLH